MAEPELAAADIVTGSYAFRRVGDVCATPEEELQALPPPLGNAHTVVAASAYGLVFFADARGAKRAAAKL